MYDLIFSRNLIKGRIAETIFEEMFKQSEEFTVIPLGYEHTVPELAQYQHHVQVKQVLDNIRSAPDFALISRNKERVYLVEVKYRHTINYDEIRSVAERLSIRWSPSFLFFVSPHAFYFESTAHILQKNGEVSLLSDKWISPKLRHKYLELVHEFY